MSSLMEIHSYVQSIAEVISAALKVDTEIVDYDGRVVGATGRIRGQLLTKRTDRYVNRYVLSKLRPFVLTNPGEHPACAPCPEKNECIYTGGIFFPINVKEKCYGVISLVSFDTNQKKILTDSQNTFLDFTGKMAELLGTKLSETIILEQTAMNNKYLEAIINSVNEGIIATDENGNITYFNGSAEKILGIAKDRLIGKPVSAVFPNSLLNKSLCEEKSFFQEKIHYQNLAGETVHLISSATLVKNGRWTIGAVESFSEEEKIFQIVHRLSDAELGTAFNNIVGKSKMMQKIKLQAMNIAQSSSTVLITGESGTGKELFAKAIHSASPRAKESFVPINCSAIPDTLLESELFGYEKGAFTGAKSEGKPGKFQLANGGTLFLDEIGDMPLHLQVKILRVLQERVVQKIGGTKNIPINVRIIAATHHDLKELIEKKLFREDLYYRLNVIPLNIPPLRERAEDIPVLLNFLCTKYSNILNKIIKGFSKEAMNILLEYSWPGNVRELENAVEYAINFCPNNSYITEEVLPQWLFAQNFSNTFPENYQHKIETSEKQILEEALRTVGTSLAAKKQIAASMGISIATLYRLLRKHNI